MTFINEERMRDIEQAGVVVNQQTRRFIGIVQGFSGEGLNGVRAEEKFSAFGQLSRTIMNVFVVLFRGLVGSGN